MAPKPGFRFDLGSVWDFIYNIIFSGISLNNATRYLIIGSNLGKIALQSKLKSKSKNLFDKNGAQRGYCLTNVYFFNCVNSIIPYHMKGKF